MIVGEEYSLFLNSLIGVSLYKGEITIAGICALLADINAYFVPTILISPPSCVIAWHPMNTF